MHDGGARSDKPAQWRKWTLAQACAVLDELETAGKDGARSAPARVVTKRRSRSMQQRPSAPSSPAFVAVEMPPAARIEIEAGGVVVRVREDADVEQVARLVEAIGRRLAGSC